MVKPGRFDSNGVKKGAWSQEEDERLRAFVHEYGHTNWRLLPVQAGKTKKTGVDYSRLHSQSNCLARCGKSCRLRWVNYLQPGLKRGKFTKQEEELIIKLHDQLGNRWSAIAVKMPGRTDNEIKNYWHAHINKRGRRRPPIPLPQEQVSPSPSPSSSSENEFSSTHHLQEEETTINSTHDLNPIADLYSFAPAPHDQGILSAADHVDLPPFPVEEEFRDFQLFQQMQINASSTTGGEFIRDFYSESFGEDVFDILELW